MKKLAVLMLVTLLASLTFLSSCKKDESAAAGSQPSTSTCKVNTVAATLFGGTGKTTFSYNDSSQVTETATTQDGDVNGALYTYNNAGQVTKIESYKDAGKLIFGKTEYSYSSNGVIEEKIYFDDNGVLTHYETRKFEYTNGVISKVSNYTITNGNESLDDYALYTYNSKGDVSMIEWYEDDGNGKWMATDRDSYTYSTQVANKVLIGFFEDDPNFPAKHYYTNVKDEFYNSISKMWVSDGDLSYNYTFDGNGNPTNIIIGDGRATATLKWDCQ